MLERPDDHEMPTHLLKWDYGFPVRPGCHHLMVKRVKQRKASGNGDHMWMLDLYRADPPHIRICYDPVMLTGGASLLGMVKLAVLGVARPTDWKDPLHKPWRFSRREHIVGARAWVHITKTEHQGKDVREVNMYRGILGYESTDTERQERLTRWWDWLYHERFGAGTKPDHRPIVGDIPQGYREDPPQPATAKSETAE